MQASGRARRRQAHAQQLEPGLPGKQSCLRDEPLKCLNSDVSNNEGICRVLSDSCSEAKYGVISQVLVTPLQLSTLSWSVLVTHGHSDHRDAKQEEKVKMLGYQVRCILSRAPKTR